MYSAIEKIWLKGSYDKPPRLRREVALTNQIALFAAVFSLPYDVFYIFYDFGFYLPIILANIVFIALYACVPFINGNDYPRAARNLMLVTACTQISVITWLSGSDGGVQLFFFAIGSLLSLLFFGRRNGLLLALLILVTGLFLLCQFGAGAGVTPIPDEYAGILFGGSVIGTMALSSSIAYLYRLEIDRAEERLLESNRNLEKLSTTDQLTGLANRRSFDQFLDREWGRMARSGQSLSMLMCDVDFFKAYNDHYGHHAGDICLQRIASALQKVVRRPSDLLVRYGGEEFAVILPSTTEAGARKMAERIRHAVEQLAIEHGHSGAGVIVTMSLGGCTLTPDPNSDWHPLLEKADGALYLAKTCGRNRVVFDALE